MALVVCLIRILMSTENSILPKCHLRAFCIQPTIYIFHLLWQRPHSGQIMLHFMRKLVSPTPIQWIVIYNWQKLKFSSNAFCLIWENILLVSFWLAVHSLIFQKILLPRPSNYCRLLHQMTKVEFVWKLIKYVCFSRTIRFSSWKVTNCISFQKAVLLICKSTLNSPLIELCSNIRYLNMWVICLWEIYI